MSFERFSVGPASWDDGPGDSAPSLPVGRDGRIHDVLTAIEQLEQERRPDALTERQWFHLLRDLRHVAEQWLDLALVCGWSLDELFGSPPQFGQRVGLMGAALLLKGRTIESIDAERIVIANRLGAPSVFRRWPGADRHGQLMVWDVVLNGGAA